MPRRGGKPLHPVKWLCENGAFVQALTAPGTNLTEIVSPTAFDNFASPTIMRIRGNVFAGLARNTQTASTSAEYACGLIVLPDGITPGSILDGTSAEWEWMWLHHGYLIANSIQFPLFNSSGTETGVHTSNEQTYGIERVMVDVRARRRIPAGSRLAFVSTWEETVGTPDVEFRGLLRTLVQD